MDIKRKTSDIRTWKKEHYFSTYPPPTLIHLSHRFISALKSAAQKSFDCCLSHTQVLCQYRLCKADHAYHVYLMLQRQLSNLNGRKLDHGQV
jgi:hypothetical protein